MLHGNMGLNRPPLHFYFFLLYVQRRFFIVSRYMSLFILYHVQQICDAISRLLSCYIDRKLSDYNMLFWIIDASSIIYVQESGILKYEDAVSLSNWCVANCHVVLLSVYIGLQTYRPPPMFDRVLTYITHQPALMSRPLYTVNVLQSHQVYSL